MTPLLPEALLEVFVRRHGAPPAIVVRAPGRVNLIGEHTDYNDGFVLPLAIDRAAWIALAPRDDGRVRIASLDFGSEAEFDVNALGERPASPEWVDYVRGTAWALREAGLPLAGWDGVLAGDVPIGAGLSSSAAIELATARAFAEVARFEWDGSRMAQLAQRAENAWVGMKCGIMDQMISAVGERGRAVLIDCRSLATRAVPLPDGTLVAILDTGTRRGLVDSAYNIRRAQCERAAKQLGVRALRDVSVAEFERRAGELEPTVRRRARHVVTENERTLAAAAAMERGDSEALGEAMRASHVSLRDDFEVSSPALDAMAEIANMQEGCIGARMTGGGFAGCAVAVVRADAVESFVPAVEARFRERTGLTPTVYVTSAREGASVWRGA